MTGSFAGCTLSSTDFVAARERYASAAEGYEAAITLANDRVRVELKGPKPELSTLLDEMIERESGCCRHLHFEVDETATGYEVILSITGNHELANALLADALPTLFPGATINTG